MNSIGKIEDYSCHGRYNDDGKPTHTSEEQKRVENLVDKLYRKRVELRNKQLLNLFRNEHICYLQDSLFMGLNERMAVLDSSRPWLVYWIAHSLALLGKQKFLRDNDYKIVDFLKRCRSLDGGYGGGPQQEGHLAATYAATNALITIGGAIAYESFDREAIRKFLLSMQQSDGSFTMHASGEVDIRGAYCALSVAKILNMPIYSDCSSSSGQQEKGDGLFAKTADWILSCQTYEGGFGAAPGHEAHGGYTFCGVATLVFLNQLHRCNIDALIRWTANKQLQFEGGFSGRTNKLVDGCYSFWNGAVIPIIQTWLNKSESKQFHQWLINQEALQKYILICCQDNRGGLWDKPGSSRDFYHTCYTLSGLSLAQNSFETNIIVGDASNSVEPMHPLFNVTLDCLAEAKEYFLNMDQTKV
ncbi:hypothetical protein RDWZM_009677 [Blomia tropicalis]|uniref:Protein farnesyltransferase subunit beta n=1 Tax=Blomia tropicalis TaxID=40697 RepID=A0A9Q0M3I5_BLOTA|nr:hypothetical protein RDWZM_009677 [Blomia tropicalis]